MTTGRHFFHSGKLNSIIVNILTPFDNISREITNQVLLMENVIVGGIPNTYYNLEGLHTSEAMEVME